MTPEVIAVMKMTMLKAGLSMAFMSSLVNIGSLTLQNAINRLGQDIIVAVSYTHLRAHETDS